MTCTATQHAAATVTPSVAVRAMSWSACTAASSRSKRTTIAHGPGSPGR